LSNLHMTNFSINFFSPNIKQVPSEVGGILQPVMCGWVDSATII